MKASISMNKIVYEIQNWYKLAKMYNSPRQNINVTGKGKTLC